MPIRETQVSRTDYALTKEDALAGCIRIGMEPEAARCMVDETFRDLCHISGKPMGPLGRWNECLHEIRLEHGQSGLDFALTEMGFTRYRLPEIEAARDPGSRALSM